MESNGEDMQHNVGTQVELNHRWTHLKSLGHKDASHAPVLLLKKFS